MLRVGIEKELEKGSEIETTAVFEIYIHMTLCHRINNVCSTFVFLFLERNVLIIQQNHQSHQTAETHKPNTNKP